MLTKCVHVMSSVCSLTGPFKIILNISCGLPWPLARPLAIRAAAAAQEAAEQLRAQAQANAQGLLTGWAKTAAGGNAPSAGE